MKVKLDYNSLNLWQVIASHFPFRSKKYVARWAALRKDKFEHIWIGCGKDDILRADIQLNSYSVLDDAICGPQCRGISMRDLWDNMLKRIALRENMRNAEELCIWLDMQP